jgi:hypothetical protein
MAMEKITEQEQASSVSNSANVLVTQNENIDGSIVESLRRAPLAAFIAALRNNGVNNGYVTTAVLQNMYPDLVKNVEAVEDGIKVTFFDDAEQTIPISAGGLAFDSGYVDANGMLHLTANGEDIEDFDPFFVGSGGGGEATGSTVRIVNRMASRNLTVMSSVTSFPLDYSWTSLDSDTSDPTGSGTAHWYVNNTRVTTQTGVAQGNQSFNIRQYLTDGTANTVKLTIEDSYGTTKSFSWTVTVSSLSLAWNLEDISYHGNDAITLRLTPNGTGEKTLYVTVDGTQVYTATTTATGRAISTTIEAQTHGAHIIEAWMSVVVDGDTVTTDHMRHTGIWTAAGTSTPVIAVAQSAMEISQFATGQIKYMIYNPESETASAALAVNGTVVSNVSVGRGEQTWAYRPTATGTQTLTITSGATTATITVTVTSIGYDISEVAGAVLTVDPTGHTNSESGYNTFGYKDGNGTNHPFTYSSNFDWVNGGFQQDGDGVTAFVVKRGTYVTLDRSLFNDNARTAGKEIKMIFKAVNVRDYDTEIANCLAGGIGLKLQAQQATLKSDLESVVVPYCEEQKIELDINIESDGAADNRFAMVWLKGIPSRAFVYSASDSWQQATPTNLRIGSEDADVWIYKIKMYPTVLTRYEILDNYIADCADVEEMVARYERNDVYGNNGDINIEKIANANPTLRVIHISADRMTTSKSDEVTCTVRVIFRSGSDTHNFVATGVKMKAQGTSSLDYIAAALNLDLDFSSATDWTDAGGNEMTGYSMTANSIPVSYLNIKLNVASSENANNVIFADDYNAYQPFITPQRQADSRVRDTVEGHPCVVFFTNTSDSTIQVSSHTVEPGETIFYGCGDMNNSKKNNAVFGQSNSTYEDLCCIEILNNNSPQCLFQSDDLTAEDFSGDHYFEPRYPKTLTAAMKAAFQEMLSFVVSTNRAAATNDPLAEAVTYDDVNYTNDTAAYRAAKFKAEVGNYFTVDSLTYHYLFTERHCMVDNRAKNTFISYEWDSEAGGYRWNFNKDYDNDTADGNDNSGGLTFTYGLEDSDSVGGAMVFNAYDSVLWCNVRDLLTNELIAMYKDREAAGAWNAARILAKFKTYQSARPEAAYIEDAWAKYIAPYLATGETRYFGMLYGTKEDQRQQYETYQERYMATKYNGALATSDSIEFRASSQIDNWQGVEPSGDMTIKPYSDMYIIVKYGNAGTVKVRAQRGQTYQIVCPTDNLVDTETYIYLASNITEIGGLAGLYTRVATLSSATRLQKLELGSNETGYNNNRLTQISFGNNPLLEYIDLRGTPNLAQSLDLSGLASLEELYVANSGVTGVTFAVGAPVVTAWLPTVQNLVARGLTQLVTFRLSGTNLTKIWVENSPNIDTYSIIEDAANIYRGRLTNVNWADADADLLLSLIGKKGIDAEGGDTNAFVLTGAAHVESVTQSELTALQTAFPNLAITYDAIVPEYTVEFQNYDGTVLNTQTIRSGGKAKNPIATGLIDTPTKPSTVDTVYSFIGWDTALTNITEDTTITATYSSATRYYTVNWWYDNSTLLYSERVEVYGNAVYSGEDLTPPGQSMWFGWDHTGMNVTSDLDIKAVFISPVLPDESAVGYDYIYSDDPEDDSGYTLAEFYGIFNAGRAKDFFNVGDLIKIVPNTTAFADQRIILKLAGFNHYKLADGSGNFAQAVFHMVGVMNATRQMNSTNTNTTSWKDCSMRNFLSTTVYNALPQQWKALIKQVNVLTSAGGTSETIITTQDKLFLLSYAEVGFGVNEVPYKNEIDASAEQKTFAIFTDNNSRIRKTYNGEGAATGWWLRSPGAAISTYFCGVYNGGSPNGSNASGSYGVAFGFCL